MTPIEAVFAVIIFFVGLLAGRMGAALIDLKVRRDPRVVVLEFPSQLNHRNHVRRQFSILHGSPFWSVTVKQLTDSAF